MKIGIGIDTGGTCTDAVVYQFEEETILAFGKTPTTKEDLSIGIGRALDELPGDLVRQAEVIALSTTLATNACVENTGGRAKLIFFGVSPGTVRRVGSEYGLSDDSVLIVASKTKPNGEITEYPDWDAFEETMNEWLPDCDAVGVVELFSQKTGAQLEQQARELIRGKRDIPVVCGYTLFSENNIMRRGASALLNARLLSVVDEFLTAVKKALAERHIQAPFVIVRSDGSLMTGDFTAARPVETLLSGPVASVMGASALIKEPHCIVVDIGGTTTDIAFVKNHVPQRVKTGIRIGQWDTFVRGLFVDTFALGGDSGVIIDDDGKIALENERVLPLCMAAEYHPSLLTYLENQVACKTRVVNQQKNIYVTMKDIRNKQSYSEEELQIAEILKEPMSLEQLKGRLGEVVLVRHIERLIREGILIRCGLTITDLMHVKGSFVKYKTEASRCGVTLLSRALQVSDEELMDMVMDEFKRKLYFYIMRSVIEDACPSLRKEGIDKQVELLINTAYKEAKENKPVGFLKMTMSTPYTLIGVGAPTKYFIEEVGRMMGARVLTSEYSPVANALGAVVGKVEAESQMEVMYHQDADVYFVYGGGEKMAFDHLEEAKEEANRMAWEHAREEAIMRGADENEIDIRMEVKEDIVDTEYGALYMGYKVVAKAAGGLRL